MADPKMVFFEFGPESKALIERAIKALESRPAAAPATGGQRTNTQGGPVFPNFGRKKGEPIAGAAMQDLEFYANAACRSLADPSKERFHPQERERLQAINAEITRQGGTPIVPASEVRPDGSAPGYGDFGPPPNGAPQDQDIPF